MRIPLIVILFCAMNLAAYAAEKPSLQAPNAAGSPWLAYLGQPPEEGAIGVLNMPLPDRYDRPALPLFVYWPGSKQSENVPADTFLSPQLYWYKDLNSGEQCNQTQLLYFDVQGEWALLYGRRDWAWVSIRQNVFNRCLCRDEELISLLEAHVQNHVWCLSKGSDETMETPNRQGYAWGGDEEFIQLPPGPLPGTYLHRIISVGDSMGNGMKGETT